VYFSTIDGLNSVNDTHTNTVCGPVETVRSNQAKADININVLGS